MSTVILDNRRSTSVARQSFLLWRRSGQRGLLRWVETFRGQKLVPIIEDVSVMKWSGYRGWTGDGDANITYTEMHV